MFTHNTSQVFSVSGQYGHAFTVARRPGSNRAFLIDGSLRQFFRTGAEDFLQVGPKFRVLNAQAADALLKDGYILLDDSIAAAYGNAFRIGKEKHIYSARTLLTSTIKFPIGKCSGYLVQVIVFV